MHNSKFNEDFMQRCFDLALLGKGYVAPNPMVGAVLVYQNNIIGEGYHQRYGGPHAEVNAVASVADKNRHLIHESTLYVSLEPCNFVGKTPACTSLIMREKIPRVVISSLDDTPIVAGKSVRMLREAGVEVITNVLKKQGEKIASIRSSIVTHKRPYIFLKYAQTQDGYIAPDPRTQFWISSPLTKHLVHKWRAEADAIIVGTNTIKIDNPALTNRLYSGGSPMRIVLDKNQNLDPKLKVFDRDAPTLVVSEKTPDQKYADNQNTFWQSPFDEHLLTRLMAHLYELKIGVLMVEGGAKLLKSFINAKLWDEARVIIGNRYLGKGILAPRLPVSPLKKESLGVDQIQYFYNS